MFDCISMESNNSTLLRRLLLIIDLNELYFPLTCAESNVNINFPAYLSIGKVKFVLFNDATGTH